MKFWSSTDNKSWDSRILMEEKLGESIMKVQRDNSKIIKIQNMLGKKVRYK